MFKQSLKLWPNDLKTLLLGGESYLRLNNVEKAVKMFSTVLRLQPGNEIAKKKLAQIS
jgi:cytochrome c-type biogenesis protein CcmH/NrfG